MNGAARYFNWIRAGTYCADNNNCGAGNYDDYTAPMLDEDEVYEDVIDGTFAPMAVDWRS